MDIKGTDAGELRHVNIVSIDGSTLEKEYQPARLLCEVGLNERYHLEGSGRLLKFAHVCWAVWGEEILFR
jgi:hypothetical protein